ncbi:hypothetical protein B6N13_18205 [Marinomonas sp. UCMA 3892]|nr:hypothetical protein [Marinomonas sp. UCMA 3892]
MYLNDWYWCDKPFVERLGDTDKSERLKALHAAAKFYKVTRNFKKVEEENRLVLALDLFESVQGPVDSENIVKTVSYLSEALKAEYDKTLSLHHQNSYGCALKVQ